MAIINRTNYRCINEMQRLVRFRQASRSYDGRNGPVHGNWNLLRILAQPQNSEFTSQALLAELPGGSQCAIGTIELRHRDDR